MIMICKDGEPRIFSVFALCAGRQKDLPIYLIIIISS